MRSAFLELNTAASALFAAQVGLQTTNHNIANANTTGYTRQVVMQQATRALQGASRGMLGTGVDTIGIQRIRDFYVDVKYWKQSNLLSEYSKKTEELSEIDSLFKEPSDEGFNKVMNSFFDSLQALSTNTSNPSYFENVKQTGLTVTSFINSLASSLMRKQETVNLEIKGQVDRINSLANQITSLNAQIDKAEANGAVANDLRDRRELLVDQLSQIVNVEVEEIEHNKNLPNGAHTLADRTISNKSYIVRINGQVLVDHYDVNELEAVVSSTKNNPEDAMKPYDIRWKTGLDFDEHNVNLSGSLKALIDVRDGNGGNVFKGTITNVDDLNRQITVSDSSRFDLEVPGTIRIGSAVYKYTDFSYDEATGETTFTLDASVISPLPFNAGDKIQVGKDVAFKGVPYYINKLNELVRTVARAMNDGQYRNGSAIPGMQGTTSGYNKAGETGIYLFTYTEGNDVLGKGDVIDYNKMTALNFSLSKDILDDASSMPISTEKNPAESRTEIISFLNELKHNKTLFKQGEITDYMGAIMSEIAVDTAQAKNFTETQENIVKYIENSRMAVSGVDPNEEMTNMIKFQAAYQAAARMVNIIDQIYDVTINGLMSS